MIVVDASRALKKIEKLEKELNEQVLGAALQKIALGIADNMKDRLLSSETGNARTTWREDTSIKAFKKSRKHYIPGARAEIADALAVTPVTVKIIDGRKMLWVGIGDIKKLNAIKLSQPGDSSKYKLWKILEYGTGLFTTYPDSPKRIIYRRGTQRFPVRTALYGGFLPNTSLIGRPVGSYDGRGRLASPVRTANPGQAGRHYLFAVSGELYQADRTLIQDLTRVIDNAVSGARR